MARKNTRRVTVDLPADLHDRVQAMLEGRRLTMGEVVSLYLRSMVTGAERNRTLGPGDLMPFGKYRGSEVGLIIRAQPDYIQYLLANSQHFSLSVDALELLAEVEGRGDG